MNFKKIESTLKQVYKDKKYLGILIIAGLTSFVVLYWLMVAKIADNSLRIFIMMSGYNYTYFTLLSFVIISFLFGTYLSIAIFKFDLLKKSRKNKKGFSGSLGGYFGLVAGVFGAGCPTCGAVIFGLIGAPLALMYLPFKGAELRVLAIGILLFSNYTLIKSLNKCEIPLIDKKN